MTFFGMALLTAIGTVVLAVFAVFTAWYALKAFREQSKEVAAIEQQVRDEQELTRQQGELLKVQSRQLELQRRQFEQQDTDRRRAQAIQVYMWQTHNVDPASVRARAAKASGREPETSITAHIRNTSLQPIHDVRFTWQAVSPELRLSTRQLWRPGPLMPEHQLNNTVTLPPGTGETDVSAAVIFRDRAGAWWRTRPDGRLEETPQPPDPVLPDQRATISSVQELGADGLPVE